MTSHYFRPIQVSLYSLGFILLGSLGMVASVSATSAPCGTISEGVNVTISSDCSDLKLDGAGNVVINSGVRVASEIPVGSAIAIDAQPGITTSLTNSGTLSAVAMTGDATAKGIMIAGGITNLTNSGTISAEGTGDGASAVGIVAGGDPITILTNSGTISGSSDESGAAGISNSSTITTLNNSGSALISGTTTGGGSAVGILNDGTITTLTNSGSAVILGTTTGGGSAYGILNNGTINILTNSGRIEGGADGTGVKNFGTINILTNSGRIEGGAGGAGVDNFEGIIIRMLTNSGTILAGASGFGIDNGGSGNITTLTNLGTIEGGAGGIDNTGAGTIVNLNNAQGGNGATPATTALTYNGNLPTKYNIIINSATHYGQLAVADPAGSITTFGIYGAPFLTSRTYAGVLTNNVTVTNLQATYDNMTLALVNNALTGTYDLMFTGASLMGTQQSLVNTANALAPIYAMQNAVLVNSFTYDCTLFDVNNICISVGGRNTQVSAANGLNNTSALLIAAYRPHPNYRIGAYADQNFSVNNAGSTVSLTNSTPLIGIFGAWTQNQEGTGAEVRVSAAYGQKDTTITRQVVGLSEPGSGSSTLNSQGAQVTAKYGFAVIDKIIVSPYVGVRYTQNNMNGYTEGTSSSVTAPLTYGALNTNATTALAGVGASYQVIPAVTTFASAGVETDTNTANGTYSATGINGLTPANFNANPVRTRPTATVGAYYDIAKNQRFGVTGIYRQEAYQAVSTTTVMATYTIGL